MSYTIECPKGHRLITGYSKGKRRKTFRCPYCKKSYWRREWKNINGSRSSKKGFKNE